ncbi:hypothetical protein [Janthinobacterium tructae]|jgi:hypothetical protein|uniref:Uncharacterized protein n=1 Tax=Janthinobacterium tructae TaxID=2590869 RepID=A0A4Y6RC57_9BURK|nr:hypothetical protein [Janthinobacterium tructae]QDG70156.1 hypothetical protein FJQ89_06795 [Janthinobacterium tructae]
MEAMMDGADEVHGLAVVQKYIEATEKWRPGSGELVHLEAFRAALHLGYEDYFDGREEMPLVFLFNESLQELWLEGIRLAKTAAEMRLCRAHGGWTCDCAKTVDGMCWRNQLRQRRMCERRNRVAHLVTRFAGAS